MNETDWEAVARILAQWLAQEDSALDAEELIDVAIGTVEQRGTG